MGPAGGPPKPGQNRFNRVVVLKGMFAPADIDKDPALLLELKEDVREECETMGQVTSCTLFDVSSQAHHMRLVADPAARGKWSHDGEIQRSNRCPGMYTQDERAVL